jgi:hypothetical protein
MYSKPAVGLVSLAGRRRDGQNIALPLSYTHHSVTGWVIGFEPTTDVLQPAVAAANSMDPTKESRESGIAAAVSRIRPYITLRDSAADRGIGFRSCRTRRQDRNPIPQRNRARSYSRTAVGTRSSSRRDLEGCHYLGRPRIATLGPLMYSQPAVGSRTQISSFMQQQKKPNEDRLRAFLPGLEPGESPTGQTHGLPNRSWVRDSQRRKWFRRNVGM